MIIVVTGKLGSGKTYFAVNYLIKKFYTYEEDIFQYVPKGELHIVTNIDSLSLPHIDLQALVDDNGLRSVFCDSYVKSLGKGNVVFIIDEAQGPRYFHKKFYDADVFLFFQRSRHIGVDVILLTQDTYNLCGAIRTLCEYEVAAIQRTSRAKNVFMYKYRIGDDVFKRSALKFSMRVAELYSSFSQAEKVRIMQPWKKYMIVVVCLVGAILGGFFWMLHGFKTGTIFGSSVHSAKRATRTERARAGLPVKIFDTQDAALKEVQKEYPVSMDNADTNGNTNTNANIDTDNSNDDNNNDNINDKDSDNYNKTELMRKKLNLIIENNMKDDNTYVYCSDNNCIIGRPEKK